MIGSLISLINKNMSLQLDENYVSDRSGERLAQTPDHWVVVGASHAKALAAEMSNLECNTSLVEYAGRQHLTKSRAVAIEVEHKLNQLRRDGKRNIIIVYHLLDSAVYMNKTEEGEYLLLKRDESGRFHCPGDLIVAPKEIVEDKFKLVEEVVAVERGVKKIFVAPLARYIYSGCCQDNTHCRNRTDADYVNRQLDSLEKVRETIKGAMFRANLKGAKVLAFNRELMGMGEKAWRGDGVHITAEGYQQLAISVRRLGNLSVGTATRRGNPGPAERKRRRDSSEEHEPQNRANIRSRLGSPVSHRTTDDRRVVVVREDEPGAYRGRGRPRGGRAGEHIAISIRGRPYYSGSGGYRGFKRY